MLALLLALPLRLHRPLLVFLPFPPLRLFHLFLKSQ
jgi:hypothetical protein